MRSGRDSAAVSVRVFATCSRRRNRDLSLIFFSEGEKNTSPLFFPFLSLSPSFLRNR